MNNKKNFYRSLFFAAALTFSAQAHANMIIPMGMDAMDGSFRPGVHGDAIDISAVATLQDNLDAKQQKFVGSASQYVQGNGSLGTFPTNISTFTNNSGYITASAAPVQSVAGRTGNVTLTTADIGGYVTPGSVVRTTTDDSRSIVGTGATGWQISATKDSTVRYTVSAQTTSTIGGPSTSLVTIMMCATNSVTESDWAEQARLENDQTVTLAVIINSLQIVKGQLNVDVPAGYYVKIEGAGTGTHTETFVKGKKTIYG